MVSDMVFRLGKTRGMVLGLVMLLRPNKTLIQSSLKTLMMVNEVDRK